MPRRAASRPFVSIREAIARFGPHGERVLIQAHVDGKVTLTGRQRTGPNTLAERKPMPKDVFADAIRLDATTNSTAPDGATKDFRALERATMLSVWVDVAVDTAALDKLVRGFRGSKADEIACTQWLADLMRASPETRPQPKADYLREARDQFHDLTDNGFHRAWAAAILETDSAWGKPGAPGKRQRTE